MYKYTFNLAIYFLKRLSEKSEITEAQNPLEASEGSPTTTAEAGSPTSQERRAASFWALIVTIETKVNFKCSFQWGRGWGGWRGSYPVLWMRSYTVFGFSSILAYLHVSTVSKYRFSFSLQTRVAPRLCSARQTQLLVMFCFFSADNFDASGEEGGGWRYSRLEPQLQVYESPPRTQTAKAMSSSPAAAPSVLY